MGVVSFCRSMIYGKRSFQMILKDSIDCFKNGGKISAESAVAIVSVRVCFSVHFAFHSGAEEVRRRRFTEDLAEQLVNYY